MISLDYSDFDFVQFKPVYLDFGVVYFSVHIAKRTAYYRIFDQLHYIPSNFYLLIEQEQQDPIVAINSSFNLALASVERQLGCY